MRSWKISGSVVLILFLITLAWIWIRQVDGAGIVQTMQIKEITTVILVVAFLPVLIGYLIWLAVLLKKQKKQDWFFINLAIFLCLCFHFQNKRKAIFYLFYLI